MLSSSVSLFCCYCCCSWCGRHAVCRPRTVPDRYSGFRFFLAVSYACVFACVRACVRACVLLLLLLLCFASFFAAGVCPFSAVKRQASRVKGEGPGTERFGANQDVKTSSPFLSAGPPSQEQRRSYLTNKKPCRETRLECPALFSDATFVGTRACNAAQVARGVPVRDLLVPVVSKANKAEGRAALELYARRIYRTHVVDNFSWHDEAKEGKTCMCTYLRMVDAGRSHGEFAPVLRSKLAAEIGRRVIFLPHPPPPPLLLVPLPCFLSRRYLVSCLGSPSGGCSNPPRSLSPPSVLAPSQHEN